MEKHKVCSFFGHRKIELTENLKNKIKSTIENLIINHQVITFLFGSRSEFDYICHTIVSELKEKYPKLKRISYTCKHETCIFEHEKDKLENILTATYKQEIHLLCVEEEREHKTKYVSGKASYIERNQAMIDDSDFCVFYYDKKYKPTTNKSNNRQSFSSKSGTGIAYSYAKRKQKNIINLFTT